MAWEGSIGSQHICVLIMPWRVCKFESGRDVEDGVVKRKEGINGGRWGVLDIGKVIIYYINSIGIGGRFRLMGSREVVSARGRENWGKSCVRVKVKGRGILYRIVN